MWYQNYLSKYRWGCLVHENGECEWTSHSFSHSFPCLDKFYESMNEIKNDFDSNQIPFISEDLSNYK